MKKLKTKSSPSRRRAVETLLSEKDVTKILDIYHPEYQYITNARIHDLTLRCIIGPITYPYTQHEVFQYITAPTTALLVSQLAYVLIGGLVIHKHPSLSQFFRDLKEFRLARDKAALKFGKLDMKFQSQIPISSSVKGVISLSELRMFNKRLHGIMSFQIGDSITGSIHAMIDDGYGDNVSGYNISHKEEK